jgi:hypothetical protein
MAQSLQDELSALDPDRRAAIGAEADRLLRDHLMPEENASRSTEVRCTDDPRDPEHS